MEQQERILVELVETTPDAVIMADRAGIIRFWNFAAAKLFGYSRNEALDHSLDLIIPDRFRQRHWDGYHRVAAGGTSTYRDRLLSAPGRRKDGSSVSLEFSMAVLHSDDGSVAGFAAILRDVTLRRNRELELEEKLRRAEASTQSPKSLL